MVFPDSNPKESRFLILWSDVFEWMDNIDELKERIKLIKSMKWPIYFAGEIAILKDLTDLEN
jgi:hypothetical protein